MLKIGVLISGSGSNLQSIIDNCVNGLIEGEVAVVISNKKQAFGLQRAEKNGIKNYFVSRKNFTSDGEYDKEIIRIFKENGVDLVVLAGYLRILTGNLIEEYENRIINIHPSLIPSFCGDGFYGIRVHEAAIERGVKLSGATVHFVDNGVDSGPIIIQESVKVTHKDTPESLQKRVLEVEHKILPLAISLYSKGKIKVDNGTVCVDEVIN